MLETLVELGVTDHWQHMIDSTTVRGHSQAAGAKGGRIRKALVEAAVALRAKCTPALTVEDALSALSQRAAKPYAGLESDQVREFKQLADENARLKKLVAELSPDKAVLQDVLLKSLPSWLQRAPSLFSDGPTPIDAKEAQQRRGHDRRPQN